MKQISVWNYLYYCRRNETNPSWQKQKDTKHYGTTEDT